jgi:hypothetical protein
MLPRFPWREGHHDGLEDINQVKGSVRVEATTQVSTA